MDESKLFPEIVLPEGSAEKIDKVIEEAAQKLPPLFTEYGKEVKSEDSIYYIHYDYADPETKDLLEKRGKLQNELDRINTRLINKQQKVELLSRFKEGVWYELVENEVFHHYFTVTPMDFVRDGTVWLHHAFSVESYKINTSYKLGGMLMLSTTLFYPGNSDRYEIKEVDEKEVKNLLTHVKNLTEVLIS
jgi:hypothetical protein